MSLIAGYQARNGRIQSAELRAKLESYRILTEDDLSSYNNQIVETRFGCLMWKYKADYPIQLPPSRDGNGNALLILGFLTSQAALLSPTQLEKAEGEFVAIHSDRSGEVHIVNDRFGSRPFYILNHENGVYFSSNLFFLMHLLGKADEPDAVGWFQVLSCGHTFGNRTNFKNVRRLPPASHLTISADGVPHENRYWRMEYRVDTALDLDSHCNKVFAAFQSGAELRSRLTGKGVLALSGGLDSRLVAGALPNRKNFSAFTFTSSGEKNSSQSPETLAASAVCKILGLEHHIEPMLNQELSIVADDVVRMTGGMRPLHHAATVMPYIREIKRRGLHFLLGGGPGDVSAGSKIPSVRYLDPRNTDECVRDFRMKIGAGPEYFGLFFQAEVVRSNLQEFDRILDESLAEINGPTAAHRITAWEMLHRWPAFTLTSVLHNHPEVAEGFCHFDYKYADLMLELPAEWLYQRNFYSCMIYRCLPELRMVPYANTGKLLSGELRHFEKESLKTRALRSVANGSRKILPKSVKRKLRAVESPSFSYFLYKNDARLLAGLREALHCKSAIQEILDTRKCLSFLDGFIADNLVDSSYSQQTELIGTLVTMCRTFSILSR